MKSIKVLAVIATALLATNVGRARVFTIGGFAFDEANSTRTVAIVDGPRDLKIQNSRFGKYSEAYLKDASVRSNEFAFFDRTASLGWQLQPARVPSSKANLHAKSVALASGQAGHRSTIELTWGKNGLRNRSGTDFVIYASDNSDGFAVSVLKEGAAEFSPAKYQMPDNHDAAQEANAFAFDLRNFSVADGELIRAIRIQNVFPGSSSVAGDKVDAVNGQGTLILAKDKNYNQAFPLLRKTDETTGAKKTSAAQILYVAALHDVEPLQSIPNSLAPSLFTIGGFTFNQSNSVRKAFIVEGPANLKVRTSALFAPHGNPRTSSILGRANDLANFDRSKTIGQLLRSNDGTSRNTARVAMHVMFPDIESAPPTPNVDRCAIELNWDGAALHNEAGNDFVVYEVEHWEGFAVSVQKAGSTQWTPYHYQFTNSYDTAHVVNAVAFDLSAFGLRQDEAITAIRIRNLFSSKAPGGADKVNSVSGQGVVITSRDSNYKSGFPLLMKPGGKEFTAELLDADIVYVVGLHDVENANSKVALNP